MVTRVVLALCCLAAGCDNIWATSRCVNGAIRTSDGDECELPTTTVDAAVMGQEDGAVELPSPSDSGVSADADAEIAPCAAQFWYGDEDGDGLGDPAVVMTACAQPEGYVANDDDEHPSCARERAPAGCVVGQVRCAGPAVETCSVDSQWPGCTDWVASSVCEGATPVCLEGACIGCRGDEDCGGDVPVCDIGSGACVQCTPELEQALCPDETSGEPGPACDPATKTCTGAPRGSVSGCGSCVSDSECEAGSRCVPMEFNGQAHGSYCLQVAPNGLCPNGAPAKVMATSALGVQGEYCFVRELLTTCEAVTSFGDACSDDSGCGATGADDGLCVGPDGAGACTYACSGARDCIGVPCTGPVGSQFCDPN